MESHKRSIAKALSWRAIATVITAIVAWVITGQVKTAITIGACDTIIKLTVYYLHERTWNHVRFGVVRPPEYEI